MDNDEIYWEKIKKRDHKAFDALFRSYYPALVNFAKQFLFDRILCEDVVQSFFVSLWENTGNAELYGTVKQYLYLSVKNRCLNELRDLRIRDRLNLLYVEAVNRQYEDEPASVDPSIFEKIEGCIDRLPFRMAQIFRLKYVGRKKVREISEILQVSENTVKTQLSRASVKVRDMLNEDCR